MTIERETRAEPVVPPNMASAAEHVAVERRPRADPLLFHAEAQPDGTYSVTLTEEGLTTFETALAIARDLGGDTRISTFSTIADIMERTAIREELSQALRQDRTGLIHAARILVLRRMVWGSEEPSRPSKIVGHIGKALIVGVLVLWALLQIWTAISDVAAIPGILAGIPNDILNLHPTSAITDVGNKISDAGTHMLYAALGACVTFIVAKLITPFARIYRHDQLIPGERLVSGALAALLRYAHRRQRSSQRV